MISYDESERRGKFYDQLKRSFLFDLNSEWVIDAARVANKTRFINHADNEKDGLNCGAKVLLVNGVHRIKLVALRDLEPGEELFFNYGKNFADLHGLSKKLPGKVAGKKGASGGRDTVDAINGMNPEIRELRNELIAERVQPSASGKQTAKKTAPMKSNRAVPEENDEIGIEDYMPPVMPDDEEDEDYNDRGEDVVEEEEEDIMDRRKRRRRVPLRYTR